MFNQNAFKFTLFSPDGEATKSDGTWGRLGFSATYSGLLDDSDELVVALRLAVDGQELSAQQSELVRSFFISWLMGLQRDLGKVVSFAVPLHPTVDHVCRIGMLTRTAKKFTTGAIVIGATVLLLDATWDLVQADFQQMSGLEVSGFLAKEIAADVAIDILLPDEIFKQINANYGLPASALSASTFTSEPLYSLLRLCAVRAAINRLDSPPSMRKQLVRHLDLRIFALFLVNSRQTEGLVCSGASENSAAVVAHTAMALGLHNNSDAAEILDRIENGIGNLTDAKRATEARTTLAAIRQNLTCDFGEIERRLNRHSASATTTEAIDMFAYPVSATFELFGSVAGSLGSLAGDTKAARVFALTQDGFKAASATIDATPDAISHAIKGGVVAEEWARSVVAKVWPFGKQAESENTANDSTTE